MTAPVPAVHIPSPRRPVGVAVPAPRAATRDTVVIPLPRAPQDSAAGRHRAAVRGRALSPSARAFVAVARAGSLTTLAAMLVLAAAVAGLADGTAPTGPAADVASTTLR